MPTPTVADMLKFANLQMAAEALYGFDTRKKVPSSLLPGDHYSGAIDLSWLTDGNEHASRFAPTEATKFVAQWEVVDHLSNTTTGFSGTLFRALKGDPAQNITAGDLVLSIRSTEFIDDVARDCVATNSMEIKAYGWAFGQISDMEAWYAKLKADGKIGTGIKLDVTGYSLGGHLATAFNLLHQNELNGGQVVTFNGAGVGQLQSGATLKGVIDEFNDLRKNPSTIALQFTDTRLRDVYLTLSGRIKGGAAVLPSDYTLLDSVAPDPLGTEYQQQQFANEKTWIRSALDRIKTIQTQVARISLGQVTDSVDGAPAKIPDSSIEQENFDYQMAVLKVQEKTVSKSVITGAYNALFDNKSPGNPQLGNQYDIVGRETTTSVTAMVSNSQWHHGTNVDVFIEDQPLLRGSYTVNDAQTYWDAGSLVPINQYTQNDFGDTHSLPLIVDSLNIQNALLQLVPTADREAQSAKMTGYLKAASNLKASWSSGTQGKAEGDVLERVLDALYQTFKNTDPNLRGEKVKGESLNTGGTWADKDYRPKFYDKLDALLKSDQFKNLAGKFTLGLPGTNLAQEARQDFTSLLTLITLSPIAIKALEASKGEVEGVLSGVWGDSYTDWQDDQTLSDAELERGLGTYSNKFLADRAELLKWIKQANIDNLQEQNGVINIAGKYGYSGVDSLEIEPAANDAHERQIA